MVHIVAAAGMLGSAATVTVNPTAHVCSVQIDTTTMQPLLKRGAGVLGYEGTTPSAYTQALKLHTVRNPGRGGQPWTCNSTSCPTPFRFVDQLFRGGQAETIQIILGPQLLEVACTIQGKNLTSDCPLPGYEGDEDMAHFLAAVRNGLLELVRRGTPTTSKIVLDIWNEPNFPGHPGTGGGGYFHKENYSTFFKVWDATVTLARTLLPNVPIVGPSAAPPGRLGTPDGWPLQREFLQLFIRSCNASNTMPDILSWHDYYGSIGIMGGMQAEMTAWMVAEGVHPLPRIGYNELIDPSHFLSPGYAAGTLSASERNGLDHAVRGCWAEPPATGSAPAAVHHGGPGVSTCFDGSLDGLLDMTSGPDPVPHGVFWPYQWYAALGGSRAAASVTPVGRPVHSAVCTEAIEVLAAVDDAAGTVSIIVGHTNASMPAVAIAVSVSGGGVPAALGSAAVHAVYAGAAPCPAPAVIATNESVGRGPNKVLRVPQFELPPGSAAYVVLN